MTFSNQPMTAWGGQNRKQFSATFSLTDSKLGAACSFCLLTWALAWIGSPVAEGFWPFVVSYCVKVESISEVRWRWEVSRMLELLAPNPRHCWLHWYRSGHQVRFLPTYRLVHRSTDSSHCYDCSQDREPKFNCLDWMEPDWSCFDQRSVIVRVWAKYRLSFRSHSRT